jgi:mitogen-activated protein kinase 15
MFAGASEEALDFLKKLLCFNPKTRLTVEQALQHPYVRDFYCPEEEPVCEKTIEISMNDNKKFSIREYREALYAEITKRKKE